jgi:hypothetical protein
LSVRVSRDVAGRRARRDSPDELVGGMRPIARVRLRKIGECSRRPSSFGGGSSSRPNPCRNSKGTPSQKLLELFGGQAGYSRARPRRPPLSVPSCRGITTGAVLQFVDDFGPSSRTEPVGLDINRRWHTTTNQESILAGFESPSIVWSITRVRRSGRGDELRPRGRRARGLGPVEAGVRFAGVDLARTPIQPLDRGACIDGSAVSEAPVDPSKARADSPS